MVINIRHGIARDEGFLLNNNIHVTRREVESLSLTGMGFSNQEAAKKLGVSINTFRNHIWNIMQKLGANSRAHAIVLAVQNGIIEVQNKKSFDLIVKELEYYVLCIFCGKVNRARDYSDARTEKVIINHVEYEMPIPPGCPTLGCTGDITETIEWDVIRKHHPEYPELPEPNVQYHYDIDWYRYSENE